jgi:hypothetical protein
MFTCIFCIERSSIYGSGSTWSRLPLCFSVEEKCNQGEMIEFFEPAMIFWYVMVKKISAGMTAKKISAGMTGNMTF